MRVSLVVGRSMTRILPLVPPNCDQSVICPRKIRANCLVVKLPWKGLSAPTMMAIFSRCKRTCSRPCACSCGVKPRPSAAISIFPSSKAFSAASVPLAATSTFVPENCFSKLCFRFWLIALKLLEPSIRTVVPFSNVFGNGNEGASVADCASICVGTKRLVAIGIVPIASSNARRTIALSFFSFCHICSLSGYRKQKSGQP